MIDVNDKRRKEYENTFGILTSSHENLDSLDYDVIDQIVGERNLTLYFSGRADTQCITICYEEFLNLFVLSRRRVYLRDYTVY
jgi:hypothetical protein